jgi:glycosyltransferase involved in cell wall biosynthesis
MVQTSIISNSKGEILNPLVSVIIPCYNQARFLSDAIDSLKAQTFIDWECIIINDGSSDNTHEVTLALAINDQRIHYVEQENQGLSGARNTGLDHAQGRYIQFLDADDLIEPDKLSLQVESLSNITGLALCYSDYRHCPENNVMETIRRDNFPPPRFIMSKPLHDIAARWETQFSIPVHSYLFDARLFSEYGIRFDITLPNHEDWDCWMRIFALTPVIKLTPGALAIYRICNTSMCVDRQQMYQGFSQAIRKQQRIFRNDPIMRRILKDKMQEIKKNYSSNRPNSVMMNFRINAMRAYIKVMPWPIQKFIINISRMMTQGNTPT